MGTIAGMKQELASGAKDQEISSLYACPRTGALPHRQRMLAVLEGFCRQFDGGEDRWGAVLCTASGRTELGGNHTDHQGGKVLTGSVDLDALACAAPNGTAQVRVYSEGYGLLQIDTASLEQVPQEEGTTAALIRGVLARMAQMGYPVEGFDAYVTSNVPGGSGLSSSACFEVLLGTVANALFCGKELPPEELAKIGQYAENVYFGKPSGLMDQMGCAIGGVVAIDFADPQNPEIHPVQVDFAGAGYALCILDAGGSHADLTADYAAVPQEMGAVAACLGGRVLSQVPEAEFYAHLPQVRAQCGDRAVLRAMHYYADCHRVEEQTQALEEGDYARYLELVNQSGASSFQWLQNITTYRDSREQPVAVALAVARHLLGEQGAVRVHGGGFAGTIQAYVPLDQVEEFRRKAEEILGPGICHVTTIRPVGGWVILE